MEGAAWTSSGIQKLYRFKGRGKNLQPLYHAEEKGWIPQAARVPRGQVSARVWRAEDLPAIGERFGFLEKPAKPVVFSIYTAKGGVLKTTVTHTIARILALHGVRVLVVGLDIQCSITDIMLPMPVVESLEDLPSKKRQGLYELFYENTSLESIIQKTDLPTLDIVPENARLNLMEKRMRSETRRETIISRELKSVLTDKEGKFQYDVVIFDNGPSWNLLIENSLCAADVVMSPAGCDVGTYQALRTNMEAVSEFAQQMDLSWRTMIMLPTLLDNTKISHQIYGAYLSQYSKKMMTTPIRRAVKGQESVVMRQSVFEYDSRSLLADDYFEMITRVWSRVNAKVPQSSAA